MFCSPMEDLFLMDFFQLELIRLSRGRISPLSTVLAYIPESLQLQKFNDYTYLHISVRIWLCNIKVFNDYTFIITMIRSIH